MCGKREADRSFRAGIDEFPRIKVDCPIVRRSLEFRALLRFAERRNQFAGGDRVQEAAVVLKIPVRRHDPVQLVIIAVRERLYCHMRRTDRHIAKRFDQAVGFGVGDQMVEPQLRVDPGMGGFIDDQIEVDQPRQGLHDLFRIAQKIRKVLPSPEAALRREPLRHGEVIQRNERFDAELLEQLAHLLVMIERRLIEAAFFRFHPTPFDGVAIGPMSQRSDQPRIFAEKPPVVAGFPGRFFPVILLFLMPGVAVDIVAFDLMAAEALPHRNPSGKLKSGRLNTSYMV